MHRKVVTVLVTVLALNSATIFAQAAPPAQSYAQYQGTEQDQAACRPDVRRYCRHAVADQMRVLACLQDHRARLSKACRSVLERNGQ